MSYIFEQLNNDNKNFNFNDISIRYRKFNESKYFRLRLIYSLLNNIPIEIENIRINKINIGLYSNEISFLKFIDQITNGTKIYISQTGTHLKFIPGTITNNYGKEFLFEFDSSRGLSYYIEGFIPIVIFGKEKLLCKISGATNNNLDLSLDCFKPNLFYLLEKIVVGDNFSIDIIKRSFSPDNTSEVKLNLPIIRFIEPLDLRFKSKDNKVVKIRGHYLSINSGHGHNSIIDDIRIIFNNFLNDVWIDKNNQNGKNFKPGYGLSLWAETTNKTIYSYDINSISEEMYDSQQLVQKCTSKIFSEISKNNSVDSHLQSLAFLLMSLSTKSTVSKISFDKLSKYTKGFIKEILDLFSVKFKISKDEIENKFIFSCLGCQMDNKNRIEGI